MDQSQALPLHKRTNAIVATATAAVAFVAYALTVAPTVSFWDCGEYIGAARSLAIPHPPGNPLFVMITRLAVMFFSFISDVALRTNLVSVIAGAATVFFIYLCVVRAVIGWLGVPDTNWKRVTTYLGGFVGGLFAGLGNTFWFSCVETEVNVVSMVFVVVNAWLALVWAQSKSPNRDRILVLIAYMVFLGIGVHMMSMLAIVPVGLFIIMSDKEKLRDWRLWYASILLFSVMYSMEMFMFAAPLLVLLAAVYAFLNYRDSRSVSLGLFVVATLVRVFVDVRAVSQNTMPVSELFQNSLPFLVLLVLSVIEFMSDSSAQQNRFRARWAFIFWVSAFSIVGFSVHTYIPIRSALNPIIDENNPQTWESFSQFIERKQYGSDNMVLRMFHRRGAFDKQFGIDSNMGFGGFHITQFFHFGNSLTIDRSYPLFATHGMLGGWWKLLLYLIPTAFVLWGWYYFYRHSPTMSVFFTALTLVGTIVLVVYMNFADGTRMERQDYEYWQQSIQRAMSQGLSRADAESRIQKPAPVHREVRERDYFFTSGFMFFGASVGLSVSCLLYALFNSRRPWMKTLAPIAVVLFAASPALPFASNFAESSRRGDYVPYDYAYNLLMSCDRDGVLFTNGDNDTFPLWALQEAYGIRKDVRIVNLSLLNTNWYILQLKHLEPKVAISYTDDEIMRLPHERNMFKEDTPIRLPKTKLAVVIPGQDKAPALRVQDKMVLNIVDANQWKKPIYMAVTVSNDNYMGLDPYLSMEGLVYRVNPEVVPADNRIDIDRTMFMLDKVYRYRNLGTDKVHLNETTYRLLANYSAGYLYVAYAVRDKLMAMKTEVDSLQKASSAAGAADSLKARHESAKADYDAKLRTYVDKLDECVALMPWDWRPRAVRHQMLVGHNRDDEALKRVREALIINPDWPDYKKMMYEVLEKMGKPDSARTVLKEILDADQDPWYTYATLAQSYAGEGKYDSAIAYMRRFQETHPGDQRANSLIGMYERKKAEAAAPKADSGAQTLSVIPGR